MRVPAALRDLTGGRATPVFDLAAGGSVSDLLDAIAVAHPALERRIRDEQGTLRPHVNLFIGDENVRSAAGVDTVLCSGDELTVLPAISGG